MEARHEIHIGERQNALRASCVRDVPPADWKRLPAGGWDAPHLLRSQLLRRSLRECEPASRQSRKRILKPGRTNELRLWPESSDADHRGHRGVELLLANRNANRNVPMHQLHCLPANANAAPHMLPEEVLHLVDQQTALPPVRRACEHEGIIDDIC